MVLCRPEESCIASTQPASRAPPCDYLDNPVKPLLRSRLNNDHALYVLLYLTLHDPVPRRRCPVPAITLFLRIGLEN